jgi:Fe-S cluster assembly protein SufB/Fe-S cluster assembly protein SufD
MPANYAATIVLGDSAAIRLTEKMKKAGLIVKPIAEALHDSSLSKYFPAPQSKQAAANLARFDSGIFLRIPANAEIEEPIYILSHPSVGRNIIVAGAGSRAKIIQEIAGDGFYSEISALHLEPSANLDFICIQNLGAGSAYMKRAAACEAGSVLNMNNAFFGAESAYVRNEINLVGEGGEAGTMDIYFGTGKQQFDSLSLINHRARSTKSKSEVRGALKGEAKLAPHGNVLIEKQARGSDAFLKEHILLLESGAEADPVPALEIDTNDVKAGHSASVSQIDEEQIFYLMARGLAETEARKMILLGFLEPALRMAETLRAHVLANIERKWEE